LNTTLELSDLDAKIGQLFMAGLPGPRLDEGTEALIRDGRVGGLILFSRNIENPLQLARLCNDIQKKALAFLGNPLFLAVDQEGGRVARLTEPFTRFPGNASIGMDREPLKRAVEFGKVTAEEMRLVGLNMDLAPVVDVQRGELERHLAGRSFGEDPHMVGLLGGAVVKSLQENGIMAVAKHFPGLGRADLDPHLHLPRIGVGTEEIEGVNLPPFRAVIAEGVSAFMTSHAVYTALDPERPATLSPAVLTDLLRKEMGYRGMVVTDDLEMGAISKHWGVAEGAVKAFEAGADILLICKDQEQVLESFRLLRGKLLREEIPMVRLEQSFERIVEAKSRFLLGPPEVSLERVKEHFERNA